VHSVRRGGPRLSLRATGNVRPEGITVSHALAFYRGIKKKTKSRAPSKVRGKVLPQRGGRAVKLGGTDQNLFLRDYRDNRNIPERE